MQATSLRWSQISYKNGQTVIEYTVIECSPKDGSHDHDKILVMPRVRF